MADTIERSELISIRDRADRMINEKHLNGRWRKAYQNLAEAADRLDAMIARTEVVTTGVTGEHSGGDRTAASSS